MTVRTYLVGGAVRDELLGLPNGDRDWVLTGATPDWMERKGYRQVGSSFPVFLHPKTGEEYALARTERKQGHGYHGFTVDFHPGVTIEQDLERRDLTINAMARDEDGNLVDPWGGKGDLDNRVLRHVSPAFAEDPLRVLRVARFAARFAPLGFRVHEQTLELMRRITDQGELEHLVPERSWSEIYRAMGSERPSVFVEVLRACGALNVLLPEVNRLFGIPQPQQYHPEIDTGVHLCMALDMAADLGCSADGVFAVLLHDLGKGVTPAVDLPAHHGHEDTGLPLVESVCERLKAPVAVRRLALQVCSNHLRCHRLLEARPAKVMKLLERIDAFRNPEIREFVLACEADYRGRGGFRDRAYPQGSYLETCLKAAAAVRARDLDTGEAGGPEIGEMLRQARIAAIGQLPVNPAQ